MEAGRKVEAEVGGKEKFEDKGMRLEASDFDPASSFAPQTSNLVPQASRHLRPLTSILTPQTFLASRLKPRQLTSGPCFDRLATQEFRP